MPGIAVYVFAVFILLLKRKGSFTLMLILKPMNKNLSQLWHLRRHDIRIVIWVTHLRPLDWPGTISASKWRLQSVLLWRGQMKWITCLWKFCADIWRVCISWNLGDLKDPILYSILREETTQLKCVVCFVKCHSDVFAMISALEESVWISNVTLFNNPASTNSECMWSPSANPKQIAKKFTFCQDFAHTECVF